MNNTMPDNTRAYDAEGEARDIAWQSAREEMRADVLHWATELIAVADALAAIADEIHAEVDGYENLTHRVLTQMAEQLRAIALTGEVEEA